MLSFLFTADEDGVHNKAWSDIKIWFGWLQDAIDDYNASLNGTKPSISNFITSLKQSKVNAEAAGEATEGFSLKLLALRAKALLLNAVLGVGIGLLVSWGTKKITEASQRVQNVATKSKEAADAAQSTTSSLKDLVSAYEELGDKSGWDTEDFDQAKDIQAEILDLAKEQGTLDENKLGKLDLQNGKYEEQLGILQDITAEQLEASRYELTQNKDAQGNIITKIEKLVTTLETLNNVLTAIRTHGASTDGGGLTGLFSKNGLFGSIGNFINNAKTKGLETAAKEALGTFLDNTGAMLEANENNPIVKAATGLWDKLKGIFSGKIVATGVEAGVDETLATLAKKEVVQKGACNLLTRFGGAASTEVVTEITKGVSSALPVIGPLIAVVANNAVQQLGKISKENTKIIPIDNWAEMIPDEALSSLDQRILELIALNKSMYDQLNTNLDNKADNIKYQNNILQLTSNGKEIGNAVEITGGGSGTDSHTMRVVPF